MKALSADNSDFRLYGLLKNYSRFFQIADASGPGRAAGVSNRLNAKWWRMTGSNRRPPACKAGALPAELIPRIFDRENGGSGWARTNDPRLIKTVL